MHTSDVAIGTAGVGFVYTDAWVSMGEPADTCDEGIGLLMPYQVTIALLEMTGNPDMTSIVFDQAANCLHTIKPVLVATLGTPTAT
jgi:ornithine carbamoyltransferase